MCNTAVLRSEKKQKDFHRVVLTELTQQTQPPTRFLWQCNGRSFHGNLQKVGGLSAARSLSRCDSQGRWKAPFPAPAMPFTRHLTSRSPSSPQPCRLPSGQRLAESCPKVTGKLGHISDFLSGFGAELSPSLPPPASRR